MANSIRFVATEGAGFSWLSRDIKGFIIVTYNEEALVVGCVKVGLTYDILMDGYPADEHDTLEGAVRTIEVLWERDEKALLEMIRIVGSFAG